MWDTNGELRLQTRIRISSDKPFVHTYIHNLKTTGPIWTFCISNDSSTMQRHSLCGLELHERFNWRATVLGMHRSFFHKTLCAYTESPYIHRYLMHNYVPVRQQNSWAMTTKLMHLNTGCYTTNNAFNANNACFNIISNLALYTIRRSACLSNYY